VGKYMIRSLLSLKGLSFNESEGKVCYQYAKQSSEQERMDYLEFIARATSHIPDKGQVMVRYYGLYSNAHRGKMRSGWTPCRKIWTKYFNKQELVELQKVGRD